jgi:hypothetical protein
MLKIVAGVRNEVVRRCSGRSIDLETITNVFRDMTVIDEIVFVRFDAGDDNPILGEFARWTYRPSTYSSAGEMVEIRYAAQLTPEWRRFVVCKELCHSLEAVDGRYVTAEGVDSLAQSFALRSSMANPKEFVSKLMAPEILAEAGAVSLLCPLTQRLSLIENGGPPNEEEIAQIAQDYNLPLPFARLAFLEGYIEWEKSVAP